MTAPTVVHLRRKNGAVVVDCDIYIGRAQYQGGWRLAASAWANPFKVGPTPDGRAAALAQYEAHVRAAPALMAALPTLYGARLGCWCAPQPCHGDVLRRLCIERLNAAPPPAPLTPAAAPAPSIPDDDPVWAELGL